MINLSVDVLPQKVKTIADLEHIDFTYVDLAYRIK